MMYADKNSVEENRYFKTLAQAKLQFQGFYFITKKKCISKETKLPFLPPDTK